MKKGNLEYKIQYNNRIVVKNITLYVGDNLNFIISLKESISSAFFTVCNHDGDVVINKQFDNGIIDLGNNNYVVNISSDDTLKLYEEMYYYTMVVMIDGKSFTVLTGAIDVLLSSINSLAVQSNLLLQQLDLFPFADKTIVSCDIGVEKLRDYAFYNCTSLTTVSFNSLIKIIPDYAFAGCTSLALTSLPSEIEEIKGFAFDGCTSLALTSLPSEINAISFYVFRDCTSLALTSLPSKIKSIADYAFGNCTSLVTLTFTSKPISIGIKAFNGCTNLADIYVPWSEGAVANAPWGATNATIHYNS